MPEYHKKPGSSWSWNLANVITPTLTNQFTFSYNHLTQLVDVNTSQNHNDRTALGFNFQDIFSVADERNLIPRFQANGPRTQRRWPPFAYGPGQNPAVRSDEAGRHFRASNVDANHYATAVRSGPHYSPPHEQGLPM
jgi:hypothetical protein